MEMSSLLPSTDNLYKFLLTGGVLLIVFSIIYPLEKKQRIELEVNVYNKQAELLNVEIHNLYSEIQDLKNKSKETLALLEKTKLERNKLNAEIQITRLKDNFNKNYNAIKIMENETSTKSTIMKYEKERILILQKQITSFDIFQYLMLILGVIFSSWGLYKWVIITNRSEKHQKEQMIQSTTDV